MFYFFIDKSINENFEDKELLSDLWEKEKNNLFSHYMKVSLLKDKNEYIKKLCEKEIVFPINYNSKYCGVITLEKWGDKDEISFWVSSDCRGKIGFQNFLKESIDYIKNLNKKPLVWGVRYGNTKSYFLSKKFGFQTLFSFEDLVTEFSKEPITTTFTCNYELVENKSNLFVDLKSDSNIIEKYKWIFNNLKNSINYNDSFYILTNRMTVDGATISLVNLNDYIYDESFNEKTKNVYVNRLIRKLFDTYKEILSVNIVFDIPRNLFVINVNTKLEEIWLELDSVDIYWI